MATDNNGIYTLNEFKNKGILRLAPDFYVQIGGANESRVIVSKENTNEFNSEHASETFVKGDSDAKYQTINFRSGITQANASYGLGPGSSNCSLTYVCPQHGSLSQSLYITNPDGVKVPYFQAMMEVKVYAKGRFMRDDHGEDIPAYYPIFWGFITSVNEAYNSSETTFTLQCVDMLGWWSYQNVNVVGTSVSERWGSGPIHSTGTLYRLMNPWEIILNLFQETSFDNFIYPSLNKNGVSPPENSLPANSFTKWADEAAGVMDSWKNRYGLGLKYSIDKNEKSAFGVLEMFGVSGILPLGDENSPLTTEEHAKAKQEFKKLKSASNPAGTKESNDTAKKSGKTDKKADKKSKDYSSGDKVIRVKQFQTPNSKVEVDFGVFGRVLPFGAYDSYSPDTEPTRSSKLEVAATAASSVHFEFFQDVNGMFVFKPPFYNMDTSRNPVYVIKSGDIISADFAEDSSQIITFIEASGPILMQTTAVDWTSVHADFGLMKKYGIRESTVKVMFGNSPQELRAMAASEMAKANAKSQTGSLTISFRPEMRMGYPIYIDHMDTYYYVTGIQHGMTIGASFTTTLTLEAKRTRMYDEDGKLMRGYIQKSFEKSQKKAAPRNEAVDKDLKKSLENKGIKLSDNASVNLSSKNALGSNNQINDAYNSTQNSTDTNYYDRDLAPSDNYYRNGGYISSPEPGFYNIVQSQAFKDIEKVSSDADKKNGNAFNKALENGELSELTHFSVSTLPYTDVNGFYHIGGFPYGANMVLKANSALADSQSFYGNGTGISSADLDKKGKTPESKAYKESDQDTVQNLKDNPGKESNSSDAGTGVVDPNSTDTRTIRAAVAESSDQENPIGKSKTDSKNGQVRSEAVLAEQNKGAN